MSSTRGDWNYTAMRGITARRWNYAAMRHMRWVVPCRVREQLPMSHAGAGVAAEVPHNSISIRHEGGEVTRRLPGACMHACMSRPHRRLCASPSAG